MDNSPPAMVAPTPTVDECVLSSLAHCRQVTRDRAQNFYYGLKLTPEPKRSALYTIYAFMRACDDLADDEAEALDQRAAIERIGHFRHQMQQTVERSSDVALPDGPIWPALRHVCLAYPIEPRDLHAMLDGQVCDLRQNRYETFDDLYGYCYKVASVVGLVCLSVWGFEGGAATKKLAEYRGIALQLTNILRDLVEDARRDRIYVPVDELEQYDLCPQSFMRLVLDGEGDNRFDRFMAYQVERADDYYRRCDALDRYIHPDTRGASWAIMRIYHGLFEKIRAEPRRVLRERVKLSRWQKTCITLRAAYSGK